MEDNKNEERMWNQTETKFGQIWKQFFAEESKTAYWKQEITF